MFKRKSQSVMGKGILIVVRQRFLAIAYGIAEIQQQSIAVTQAKVREASEVLPNVVLCCSFLFALTNEKTDHVVVHFSSELTVKIAQPKILEILRLRVFH